MSNKTISQKLTQIIKSIGLVTIYKSEYGYTLVEPEDVKSSSILVGITSANPYSQLYSHYLVSTGMLDTHLPVQHIKQARIDKDNGKPILVNVNQEVAVDNVHVVLETAGQPGTMALIVSEDELGELGEVLSWDEGSIEAYRFQGNISDLVGNFKLYKIGARSSSQTRSGDLVMIPYGLSYTKYMEEFMKFNLESYVKEVNGMLSVSITIQSRLKLAASSGLPIELFSDLKYVKTETIDYHMLDGDTTTGRTFVFEDEKGNVEKFLVLDEDFTVRLEQDIVSPMFKKNGGVEVVKRKQVFDKVATDGSSYIDMSYMKKHGINRDLQIRVTPVIKGMLNQVRNLKERLGFTAIFFGGAVKGDPAPYFEDSNIETTVLGEARDERAEEDDYWMVSNQLVRDLAMYESKTLDVFEKDTKEILNRAYAQDLDALKVFVGITEKEKKEEEGVSRQLDSENLIVTLFETHPEAFLKSDYFHKRMSDFIRPASKEVEHAGRYYSKDTSYRHMVSDPYEVVRHMEKGNLAIDTLVSKDMKGISPQHVVTNSLRDGEYKLDDRKAVLGRFPLLHNLEIQVVNESGATFLSEEARNEYEELFESGHHQGIIYYSLYDMVAEAQSGADFDGDTTMVIRHTEITSLVESKPKFLDYSYLDDELVEGVPWKSVSRVDIKNILSAEEVQFLEANNVAYHEGEFLFDEEKLENDEVRELIYKTIVVLDGMTNESNNIGRFTNINATVTEMLMTLEEKLAEVRNMGDDVLVSALENEIKGYKTLNLLLASAIRWEIDKAKHGGEFYEELPFLNFLLNPGKSPFGEAKELEDRFGISLLRLLQGAENMDDVVNKRLDALGVDRITLERTEDYQGKLNMSRSMYLGKGVDKGVKYNSRYDQYIDEMRDLAAKKTTNFKINEFENGLMDEAVTFIQSMKEEGLEMELETSYEARMALERGEVVNTPARLLESYKRKMSDIQKEIDAMKGQLIRLLNQRVDGKVLNANNLSLEALMKKVGLNKEERQRGYELLARKELLVDDHKGLGEAFTPNSPKESALLFATLYYNNIRTEKKRREEELKNTVKVNKMESEIKAVLYKAWGQKHGSRKATPQERTNVNRWVNQKVRNEIQSDSGWSSIFTLFPLGAVQFLEYVKDGSIKTDSSKGRNVVVYLELKQGGAIPANYVQALQDMEGRRITFHNGEWSPFVIHQDDLSGVNKDINVSPKELRSLKDLTRRDEIKGMKFERGSHLWNRSRSGRVVLAVVYKEGVKIFMEDSQEVAPSGN